MNIRYKMKYSGGVTTSIYSLKNLENKDLIESMFFLHNKSIEILKRSLGTGMEDGLGNEVFEHDKILLGSGKVGIVEFKPGGFYIDNIPLGECEVITILKEV